MGVKTFSEWICAWFEDRVVSSDAPLVRVASLGSFDDIDNTAAIVIPKSGWSVTDAPLVNTAASCTKALHATKCNVCTGFTASLVGNDDTAPTAGKKVKVSVYDGTVVANVKLYSVIMNLPKVAGDCRIVSVSGLWIVGTVGTEMTLAFDSAGGANTFESVAMTGVQILVS